MAEFDRYSDHYDEELKRSLAGFGSIDLAVKSKLDVLGHIFQRAGLESVHRIMDFGCGTGLLTTQLWRFGHEIIGLDMSLDSLLKSKATDVFRVGYDGREIPFLNNSVDFIVASCVFHHIPPEARAHSLNELHRILVPGGIFVIIEHNPWNPVTRWVVNRCEFDADAVLLSRSEGTALFKDAGFEAVEGGYFFAVPPANPALSNIDSVLGSIPFGAQFYCHGTKRAH